MLVETENGRHLINETAYNILIETGPIDEEQFVELRDKYFKAPEAFVIPRPNKDEALAFGNLDIIDLLLYLIFPVITPILEQLVVKIKDTLVDEASQSAIEWLRNIFNNEKPAKPLLTQNEIKVIEQFIDQIIENETRRLGVEKRQARIIKHAILSRLSLATV